MRLVTFRLKSTWRSSGSRRLVASPPEMLPGSLSRENNPLLTLDVEQLSPQEIERIYTNLERRGELNLTRRERLRLRLMREILLLCMVPYVCLLVAYVSGWIARWLGLLR